MEEFFNRLNNYHEKYARFLKLGLLILVVAVILWLMPRLIVIFLPFLIAALVAKLVEPLVHFLQKYCRLPRKVGSMIAVLLGTAVLGCVVYWVGSHLVQELVSFAKSFPDFYNSSRDYIAGLVANTQNLFSLMPQEVANILYTIIVKLGDGITSWLTSLIQPITSGAFTFAKNVPSMILFVVVTFIATYFISCQREEIIASSRRMMPQSTSKVLGFMKNEMLSALFAYCKAQIKLMSITSVELFIGFAILQQEYAVLLALCLAVIDALPILGTGTVLIPWSVISFILKDFRMGIGLAIIYVVCILVRQLLEPKIIGQQIGLPPLVTLISIYAGLQLFGFLGMILVPISVLILKNFYAAGVFDWLKGHKQA